MLAPGEREKAKESLVVASEVTKRILADYEAGDLITTCAWCGRVEVDDEWVLAPHAALEAIDSQYTLSHSICPTCATRWSSSTSRLSGSPVDDRLSRLDEH
ncbi:MAG TPA: hypothetical protein VLK24_04220, partial [Gaiellaceae bacterium]|nr:hypothetical protein [Gaiellaceae bacterium]